MDNEGKGILTQKCQGQKLKGKYAIAMTSWLSCGMKSCLSVPSPTNLKIPSIPPIFSYCRLFYKSMLSGPKWSRDHWHSNHTWILHTVRRTYETAHPTMDRDRSNGRVSADRWRHADVALGREPGFIRRPAAHLDGRWRRGQTGTTSVSQGQMFERRRHYLTIRLAAASIGRRQPLPITPPFIPSVHKSAATSPTCHLLPTFGCFTGPTSACYLAIQLQ